ncbi:M15 family metallopeptidase [Alteribacter aurantiacus]|uniref:M15 family metallopeptidase n=1 Tax=Alteribacter aurantiacus TaxID=254410 RepID=UPI000408BDF1|nr:M15 family metallopeptidase [Alteribacter aurantiacus]
MKKTIGILTIILITVGFAVWNFELFFSSQSNDLQSRNGEDRLLLSTETPSVVDEDEEGDLDEKVEHLYAGMNLTPDVIFGFSEINESENEGAALDLPRGSIFSVLDEQGEWSLIDKPAMGQAWVKSTDISEVPYAFNKKTMIEDADAVDVLVNKEYRLPHDYRPDDLVIPDIPFTISEQDERMFMREQAAHAIEELFADALGNGLSLFGVSGYRSYESQQRIFSNNVDIQGFSEANRTSAVPGESEHQTGLAMDVTNEVVRYSLTQDFANTEAGAWLGEHAHKYGFIIRYTEGEEQRTGYTFEPWHLRYVGVDTATLLYENGWILEDVVG